MSRGVSPYELAKEIERIPRGMCLKIDGYLIRDLAGADAIIPFGRSGWDIVLDNVIGSAHATEWRFDTNHIDGSITVYHVPLPTRRLER